MDKLFRWGLGRGFLLFATLLFPTRQAFRYNLNEGDVSTETIVSPINFSIMKSEVELTQQREDARMSVPPVLESVAGGVAIRAAQLDTLFQFLGELRASSESDSAVIHDYQQKAPEVSEEALLYLIGSDVAGREIELRRQLSAERVDTLRTALEGVVDGYLTLGVVESLVDLGEISRGTVTVDIGGEETSQQINLLVDREQVRNGVPDQLQQLLPAADDALIKGGYEIAGIVLAPTLIHNEQRTNLRRQEAADNIPLTKGTVLKDEEIIREHTRVTPEVLEKLASLQQAMARAEEQQGLLPVLRTWFARLMLIALILSIYAGFLLYLRPGTLSDNRTLATLVLVIALELGLAFLVREGGIVSPYLLPVSVATMLLAVLFDGGVGLMTAFTLGFAVGAVMNFDFQLMLVHTAAGAAGVFAVREISRRSHFYRALWVIPLVYLIGISSVEMLGLAPASEIFQTVPWGVANGLLSVVLTIGLLPIFESLFRHATNITLLELSDLNHPLLRQLAMRAPGTYQHSLMMGELSAVAAEACGANPLLTRVGAYFHDIGKMNKPEYFVENQAGHNPHDKLSPHMSALIVASHVKEGLELAGPYRLPDEVQDFIPEHHGTQTMSFFHLKAVEEAESGQRISEDDFRYPGPRPRTKETAIVMLADAVEAASRVLQEPSPSRIRGLVGELVKRRFEEGELDECPITMSDLRLIQETFTNILTSRFHHRIDYPDKEETLKKAAEREEEARSSKATVASNPDGEEGPA
jgi:putative nucleotidyltransferase with HDIG domain